MYIQVPSEVRREHQSLWSWSYSGPLGDKQVLGNTESSLQCHMHFHTYKIHICTSAYTYIYIHVCIHAKRDHTQLLNYVQN